MPEFKDYDSVEIIQYLAINWDYLNQEEKEKGLILARKIMEAYRQEYFIIRNVVQTLEDKQNFSN